MEIGFENKITYPEKIQKKLENWKIEYFSGKNRILVYRYKIDNSAESGINSGIRFIEDMYPMQIITKIIISGESKYYEFSPVKTIIGIPKLN